MQRAGDRSRNCPSQRGDRVVNMTLHPLRRPVDCSSRVGERSGVRGGLFFSMGIAAAAAPENHRQQCTGWHDGESRASCALRTGSDPARPSVPGSHAQCAIGSWQPAPADVSKLLPVTYRARTSSAPVRRAATRSTAIVARVGPWWVDPDEPRSAGWRQNVKTVSRWSLHATLPCSRRRGVAHAPAPEHFEACVRGQTGAGSAQFASHQDVVVVP